jgi:hypothetical protein
MCKQLCRSFAVSLGCLAFVVAGCSQELPKKEAYPTRGRVLLHGKPVSFAAIRLDPTDPAQGMPADGTTDADGMFELRTYSNEEPDGVVPGSYEVVLNDPSDDISVPMPKGAKPTKIPKEISRTGVIVQIVAGDNELDIKIP